MRGNTVPNIWYDEIAFAKFIHEVYMAAVPAQSQARSNAIAMGVPYGTVITTTPNAQSHPSGAFAYMIRSGALHFRLEFYDFGPTRVRRMIEEQAEYNFLYAEYQYYEIGRSEAWFKEQCRELLNDQVKIKRELLLVWPLTTEGAVFTEDQIDELRKYKKRIVSSMVIKPRDLDAPIPPGLEIHFLEIPDPNIPYILSVDTSSGASLDYTSFTLSHPDDMRQIAIVYTNTADNDAVCAVLKHLTLTLFPKSIVVIERNYLGIILINYALKLPGLEPRMFYLEKEKEAERVVGKLVVKKKTKVRVYGVDTTTESRDAMFRYLFQIMDETPQIITSERIQDEITTLHRKKTGKIEHRPGFHDDQLMSWLIAVYADRHEQPVMRKLIGRQRTTNNTPVAVAAISNLNMTGTNTVSTVAMSSSKQDVNMDDYVNHNNNTTRTRRSNMGSLVAMMNSGFNSDEM